jgi:hypothetical protein
MTQLSGTLAIKHGSCGISIYSTADILYSNKSQIINKVYHSYPYFRMIPNIRGTHYHHSSGYSHAYLYEFETGRVEFIYRYSNDVWTHTAFLTDPNDSMVKIICAEITQLLD